MGLRPAKSHEKPTGDADWADGGAGPRGPGGTPAPRCRPNDICPVHGASRPTGASAADQGVRPTIPRGWFFDPVNVFQAVYLSVVKNTITPSPRKTRSAGTF